MFESLGYAGASASAGTWLSEMSPILLLLGAVALALVIGGLGLAFVGVRSASRSSAPSGLDEKMR